MNHAAALFGTDGENYLFKDSGPGQYNILKLKYVNSINIEKTLKVPIAESYDVRTGWWIEFRIIPPCETGSESGRI